jgi:hypothetical protein
MRTAVEGSVAADLHPVVQQAIGLNTPVAPAPPSPAPAPTRGVPLPYNATQIASPAAPTYAGLNASDYANQAEPAPRGLPQGSTNSGVDISPPGPNVNPGGVTNPQPPGARPGPPQLSFDTDPVLALVKQQTAQSDSASAANYLAQLQQMLLGYGSRGLAQDYFTKLNQDTDFQRSLGGDLWNAFQNGEGSFLDQVDKNGNIDTGLGTVAQLAYKNRNDQRNQTEGYNQGNLFFSGAHGNAISQLARNYALEGSNAQQALLAQLGGLRTGLLNDFTTHQGKLIDTENEAYNRAVDEALKYGTGDSGAGAGSSGSTTKKPAAPAKKPAAPPMAGPPDDRARKGATPPPPAPPKKKPKQTVYNGPH